MAEARPWIKSVLDVAIEATALIAGVGAQLVDLRRETAPTAVSRVLLREACGLRPLTAVRTSASHEAIVMKNPCKGPLRLDELPSSAPAIRDATSGVQTSKGHPTATALLAIAASLGPAMA